MLILQLKFTIYKELSAYKDEIMGDILFQLKNNGGSMMESRMDDLLYTFFNNKLNGALATCEAAFMHLLTDVYQEMERRGWIVRNGKSFSLTDRGIEAEVNGVNYQRTLNPDINSIEDALLNQTKEKKICEKRKLLYTIAFIVLLLILAITERIAIKDLVQYLINILF